MYHTQVNKGWRHYLEHPSVEINLSFFFNVPSKTQLGIVLWSYLCVVVASRSLYLHRKWRKKDLFSMTLLSKISAKGKNELRSLGELIPGLPREWSATKPVDHQVFLRNLVWIEKHFKIDIKIMKTLCTVQEFWTFYIQFPFFFKISRRINTANLLLCNKIHLKLTYKVFLARVA